MSVYDLRPLKALAVIVFTWGLMGAMGSAQTPDEMEALKQEIAALKKRNASLVKEMKQANAIIEKQQEVIAQETKQKQQAQEALLANAPAAERMKALAIAARQTGPGPKELEAYDSGEALALKEKPAKPKWVFKAELGGSMARGNTNTGQGTLAASAHRKTEVDDLKFKLSGLIGESDGEQNAQQGSFNAHYRRDITKQFYWYIDDTAFHDRFAGIAYRNIFNPGIGYKVIDTDTVELSFEGGPSLLVQQLENQPLEVHPSATVGQDFKWKITKHLHLFENTNYTYDFIETDNWIFNGKIGLENEIMKNIALRLTASYQYNNAPPAGREPGDFLLTTSIVYNTE